MRPLATFILAAGACAAQQTPIGVPVPTLGPEPFLFDTAEQHKIRVSVTARGLVHPWSMAFLPDGSMLITELPAGCVSFATASSILRQWAECRRSTRCSLEG
jgi:glucose/arabinose dehydrogenase